MNEFGKAIYSGRMLITAECYPPVGSDPDAVKALSRVIPSNLDAIVVADNPDRIRSSAFSVATMLCKEQKASVVLSMATRDRNRIALVSDALGAAAMNIEAILCTGGSHPHESICMQAAAANDMDAVQFIQVMKKLVLNGVGMNEKDIGSELKLQIGATAHPYLRPMELNLLRHKKKVAVGADFMMTQAIFDLDAFKQWMDAARSIDLDKRTAILPSVLPLTSLKEAKELQQKRIYGPIGDDVIARIQGASDPEKEGVCIASEIAALLKEIPGVRGIHILSGGCESLSAEIIKLAGLGTSKAQASRSTSHSVGEKNSKKEKQNTQSVNTRD
jgi:5,10-methylenetetrahydrofolate reductase